MAERPKKADPRPAPRLTLVTPRLDETAGFAALLAQALGAGDVAAVLLRLAPADERSLINRAKALVPTAQDKGAALLLDGHADLVARAGCDGAHLTGLAAFTEALETLKPERIAGCGGLSSRHDAMLAAEAGADYVMFGEPDETRRAPRFRRDRGARRLVGGSVRGALRRLCRIARGSCAAGQGRRRFRRARRLAVARSAKPRRRRRARSQAAGAGVMSGAAAIDARLTLAALARSRLRLPRSRSPPRKRRCRSRAPAARRAANVDLAYGAFQRGHYLTALAEAEKRAKTTIPSP